MSNACFRFVIDVQIETDRDPTVNQKSMVPKASQLEKNSSTNTQVYQQGCRKGSWRHRPSRAPPPRHQHRAKTDMMRQLIRTNKPLVAAMSTAARRRGEVGGTCARPSHRGGMQTICAALALPLLLVEPTASPRPRRHRSRAKVDMWAAGEATRPCPSMLLLIDLFLARSPSQAARAAEDARPPPPCAVCAQPRPPAPRPHLRGGIRRSSTASSPRRRRT